MGGPKTPTSLDLVTATLKHKNSMGIVYENSWKVSHNERFLPVLCIFGARIDRTHDDENVLKLGSNVLWCKWLSTRFLEDNCYYIVTDVAFPKELETKWTQFRIVWNTVNQTDLIV